MSCLMSCRFLVLILASPVSSLPRRFLVASSSLPRLMSCRFRVSCLMSHASCFVPRARGALCMPWGTRRVRQRSLYYRLLTLCPGAY